MHLGKGILLFPGNTANSKVNRGQPSYAVNREAVMSFTEIGQGHKAIKSFCGSMNMPPPMNFNAFRKSKENVNRAYIETMHESTHQAALESKKPVLGEAFDIETLVDIRARFDGSWQNRGYASMNGVVTAMSPQNECLDVEVLIKKC